MLLTILPGLLNNAFTGLLIAVTVYAMGGGLLEVLISPIVEACPTQNKEKAMSVLHSFYCWGFVGVIGLSTLFFALFGIASWKILALLWALIPIVNAFVFTNVPIAPLIAENETGLRLRELVGKKAFWLMMLLMVCAGASEQAVCQWASTFAEKGLGVSKTVGDLAGPMLFALLMGLSRLIYGKFGDRIDPEALHVGKRRAVLLFLPADRPYALSRFGVDWLRALRAVGRHHVAGHLQHRHSLHSRRRHGAVRSARPCRRFGLFRRPYLRGHSLRPVSR